jgi:small-conductance mechanosensitive channel
MNWDFSGWPASARTAFFSLIAIALAYLLGQVAKYFVVSRLGALARRTTGPWDEDVLNAVGRRIPFWSLLVGIYVASGFWTIEAALRGTLNNSLYVVGALSVTLLTAEILVELVRNRGTRIDPSLPRTTLTENLVRIVVVVIGVAVTLNGLGVSVTPILTALGVGGLAVALALQDTLSNLFAGFYLTVGKQFRIGNYIRLASGEEGYLVDIDWRATRLRQLTNNTILVPNAKLSQSIVTNYYLPDRELAVVIDLIVDYGSDLDRVEEITVAVAREVMRTVPGGVSTFEPFVRFQALSDPGVAFTVTLRAKEFQDQGIIRHELVKRLHRAYADAQIRIPLKSIARQETPTEQPRR